MFRCYLFLYLFGAWIHFGSQSHSIIQLFHLFSCHAIQVLLCFPQLQMVLRQEPDACISAGRGRWPPCEALPFFAVPMPGLFHYLVDSYFPGPVTADSTIPIRAVLVHPIPDEHGCVVECFLFVLIWGLQFDGSISLSKRQRLLIVKVWAFESFMPWESSYAKGKWLLR